MRTATALLALALCTSASAADDLMGSRHVVCYSGGQKIIEDDTDPAGNVIYSRTGTSYLSARSHRYVAVAADCLLTWAVPARP